MVESSKHMSMKDVGWVWEGQGLDPGVPPSIFGVGEGCGFFGLSRAIYIFHPNGDLAMRKLSHLDEVACDISKWTFVEGSNPFSIRHQIDARPERVKAEAALVSQLSLKYPNITGAFHDDMLGLVRREGYTTAICRSLRRCAQRQPGPQVVGGGVHARAEAGELAGLPALY